MADELYDKYGKNQPTGYQHLKVYRSRCNDVDIKSILINQIMKQGEGSVDSGGNYKWSFSRPKYAEMEQQPQQNDQEYKPPSVTIPRPVQPAVPPPESAHIGVADKYIYFDSGEAEAKDLQNGEMQFSIVNRNNGFPIENITTIEATMFYLPDIPVGVAYPSFYFFNRVTLNIKELPSTQTITSVNNFRFHFEYDLENAGIVKRATPVKKLFIFTKPVRDITQATLQFRVPRFALTFPDEVILLRPIPGSVAPAANFLILNPSAIQSTTTYALQFTAYTYSQAFPPSPTNTTTVGSILRQGGIMGTTDFALTTISFNVATGISIDGVDVAAENNAIVTAVVMQYKVAFFMRFRTLVDEITQYIAP